AHAVRLRSGRPCELGAVQAHRRRGQPRRSCRTDPAPRGADGRGRSDHRGLGERSGVAAVREPSAQPRARSALGPSATRVDDARVARPSSRPRAAGPHEEGGNMIGFKRPRLVAVALCTAAALAVGGIAAASIPGTGGVIHGCYNTGANPSGQLRVIDTSKGATCSKNEQQLDWNQTGPQGPRGPQGPQGLQGPQGPQGDPGPTYSA